MRSKILDDFLLLSLVSRPYAVQMKSQIESVYSFYQTVTPLFVVYPDM